MSNSARMSAQIREARENRRVLLGVGLTSRENPETSNATRIIARVNTNVTTTARASTSRNNPVPRNTTSGINRRTAAAATALPQIRSTSGRSAATSTLFRATSTPRRQALTGARSRLATIMSSPTSEVPRSSVKKNEKKRADKQVQTEKSDEVFSLPITKRDRSFSPTQLPCAVCFNELLPSAGRRLTSLKCGHTFCRSCVDKWYEISSY
uniref:RING-type domain-containing protein n=1 Tax=Rhodnius prolixus TaxID=13249 RepID=T1ID83_RHOPR